ncbi:hypothetical protein Voc01_020860 [Virgisporangium ochraceum]|uniref:OmdA domain containing protein n=2 Tax=Virgisporangium ochraceum TaxID=65505 RepID=A0A8J3ZNS4_9ACTN|nr:hypothetical protein Voc01_020860 [Virgisporangium ochraceum]
MMTFTDVDAFDRWLAAHPGEREVWVAVARKGTPGLTAAEAGDIAICHGWIDSHRRRLDGKRFLQRFSPRRAGSPWSQVNVDRVATLEAAGRMRAGGRAEVAAAKADGRWDAAYAPQRSAPVPPDLLAELARDHRARAAFDGLGRSERYSLFLPMLKARTPRSRAVALRRAVAQLQT